MKKFDVLVVGGGPGGYTAAARLSHLGKSVALFEKKKIGGSCLHVGCIPTKLLQSAASRYFSMSREAKAWGIEADNLRLNFQTLVERTSKTIAILEKGIQSRLAQERVEVVQGEAVVQSPDLILCNNEEYQAKTMVLATGSRPRLLSSFPLGGPVVTSDELLTQLRLPKSLLIIGAGVIGLEFACLFAQLGVKVRMGDILPKIIPALDEELGLVLLNSIRKLGVEVELGISEVKPRDEEMILVAVGRVPNSDQAGISSLGVKVRNGKVETNEYLQTSVPGMYAIGDLTAQFPYAHTAYEHARIMVKHVHGQGTPEKMDDTKIPHVAFTYPEIASVGKTEEQAKLLFKNVKTIKRHFAANSKARILGEIQGWCKIVHDGDSGRILGVHLVGPEATDIIGEACVLVSQGVTMDQMDQVLHPHPTLNEIFGNH